MSVPSAVASRITTTLPASESAIIGPFAARVFITANAEDPDWSFAGAAAVILVVDRARKGTFLRAYTVAPSTATPPSLLLSAELYTPLRLALHDYDPHDGFHRYIVLQRTFHAMELEDRMLGLQFASSTEAAEWHQRVMQYEPRGDQAAEAAAAPLPEKPAQNQPVLASKGSRLDNPCGGAPSSTSIKAKEGLPASVAALSSEVQSPSPELLVLDTASVRARTASVHREAPVPPGTAPAAVGLRAEQSSSLMPSDMKPMQQQSGRSSASLTKTGGTPATTTRKVAANPESAGEKRAAAAAVVPVAPMVAGATMTSGPGSRSSQNLGSGASPELFGSQADAPAAVFDIPTRRSAVHSGMVSGGSGGELRKSSSFLSRVFQREDKHAQAGAAASDTAVASAERGGVPSTGAVPRVISGVIPGSFRHEGHIGLGDDGGFDVHNIPKEWRPYFKQLGVTKKELQDDPEMAKALFSVLSVAPGIAPAASAAQTPADSAKPSTRQLPQRESARGGTEGVVASASPPLGAGGRPLPRRPESITAPSSGAAATGGASAKRIVPPPRPAEGERAPPQPSAAYTSPSVAASLLPKSRPLPAPVAFGSPASSKVQSQDSPSPPPLPPRQQSVRQTAYTTSSSSSAGAAAIPRDETQSADDGARATLSGENEEVSALRKSPALSVPSSLAPRSLPQPRSTGPVSREAQPAPGLPVSSFAAGGARGKLTSPAPPQPDETAVTTRTSQQPLRLPIGGAAARDLPSRAAPVVVHSTASSSASTGSAAADAIHNEFSIEEEAGQRPSESSFSSRASSPVARAAAVAQPVAARARAPSAAADAAPVDLFARLRSVVESKRAAHGASTSDADDDAEGSASDGWDSP